MRSMALKKNRKFAPMGSLPTLPILTTEGWEHTP